MDEAGRDKLWKNYISTRSAEYRDELIVEYAQLVKLVAGRLNMYLGYNVEYDDLVGYGIFALLTLTTVLLAIYFRKYDPFTIERHRTRSSLVYLLVTLIIMTIGCLTGSLLLGFSMIIFIILGFLAFWQHDFQ